MQKSTKMDLSVLRPSLNTVGNPLLKQLVQCVQRGTDEVRNYIEQECDLIVECKVCRSLFRGLSNFIAHKRIYCKQRNAQVVANVQSVFGEAGIAQNEAILVVCENPPVPEPKTSLANADSDETEAVEIEAMETENETNTEEKTVNAVRLYDRLASHVAQRRDASRDVLLIERTVTPHSADNADANAQVVVNQRCLGMMHTPVTNIPGSIDKLKMRKSQEQSESNGSVSSTFVNRSITLARPAGEAVLSDKRLRNEDSIPVISAADPVEYPYLYSRDRIQGLASTSNSVQLTRTIGSTIVNPMIHRVANVVPKGSLFARPPGDNPQTRVHVHNVEPRSIAVPYSFTQTQGPKFIRIDSNDQSKRKLVVRTIQRRPASLPPANPRNLQAPDANQESSSSSLEAGKKSEEYSVTKKADSASRSENVNTSVDSTQSEPRSKPQSTPATAAKAGTGSEKHLFPCPLCFRDTDSKNYLSNKCFASTSNVYRHMVCSHGKTRDEAQDYRARIIDLSFTVTEKEYNSWCVYTRQISIEQRRLSRLSEGQGAGAGSTTNERSKKKSNSNALIDRKKQKKRFRLTMPKRNSVDKKLRRKSDLTSSNGSIHNISGSISEKQTAESEPIDGASADVIDVSANEKTEKTADGHVSVNDVEMNNTESQSYDGTMETIENAADSSAVESVSVSLKVNDEKNVAETLGTLGTEKETPTSNACTNMMENTSNEQEQVDGKEYSCGRCRKSFSRLSALKNHLARFHKLTDEQIIDSLNANCNSNSGSNRHGNRTSAYGPGKLSKAAKKLQKKRFSSMSLAQLAEGDELCDDETIGDSVEGESLSELDDSISSTEDLLLGGDVKLSLLSAKPSDASAIAKPRMHVKVLRTSASTITKKRSSVSLTEYPREKIGGRGFPISPSQRELIHSLTESNPTLGSGFEQAPRRARTKADLMALIRSKRQSMPATIVVASCDETADEHADAAFPLPAVEAVENDQLLVADSVADASPE